MYEKDIIDYIKPNGLFDCPHCGLILTLCPFEFRNRPKPFSRDGDDWHLGVIKRVQGFRYSYRILRCEHEHMFIVAGAYTPTFEWGSEGNDLRTRRRRFELLCDEDDCGLLKEMGL